MHEIVDDDCPDAPPYRAFKPLSMESGTKFQVITSTPMQQFCISRNPQNSNLALAAHGHAAAVANKNLEVMIELTTHKMQKA